MPSDNTFQSAINLGSIIGLKQLSGSVGVDDRHDYYRLTSAGGRLDVELSGLKSDADLEVFDSQFKRVGLSNQSANLTEWVNLDGLVKGDYYVHVEQRSGNTHYQLTIGTFTPPSNTLNDTNSNNNTIATAYNLGDLTSNIPVNGYVGFGDGVDYYKFLVTREMDLNVTLNGLSADIDLDLFQDVNRNGVIDDRDWLLSSTRAQNSPEIISAQRIQPGTYYIRVYPSGNVSSTYHLNLEPIIQAQFKTFSIEDASGDDSRATVFDRGAIRINYQLLDGTTPNPLSAVKLEAIGNGKTFELANWNTNTKINTLINLATLSSVLPGAYQVRAIARLQNGTQVFSQTQSLNISAWVGIQGTVFADQLEPSTVGNAVVWGKGGTDVLKLGVLASEVVTLNGRSLSEYQPMDAGRSQAIYAGTAFDYLRLQNGQEFYFQGIESLQFLDRSLELQVRTNDSGFASQWNLRASDVESAWRFTQGSTDVLLVSLDTGILTASNGVGGIVDLDLKRLITDATDDDNYGDSGHGHRAISIMSATPNNQMGIAGINWNSNVLVHDVYGGGKSNSDRITFHQAIRQTIQYARSKNLKVVFQGGVQGEFWLTDGGTQAELETMIDESRDIAFYAIAAGNGNVDLDVNDPANHSVSIGTSGGVGRLQGQHKNLASVGALTSYDTSGLVNGLRNAVTVDRAGYSNYGPNLTLMATTDVPAINKYGDQVSFGGTSAANPNLAAIASLVWSVNPNLTAIEVRQILTETAMDLGDVGRDDRYGYGLVDADAAVRRAYAMMRDRALAVLA